MIIWEASPPIREFQIETLNQMIGPQIGVAGTPIKVGGFQLEGWAKAAALHNNVSGSHVNPVSSYVRRGGENTTSFLGEIGVAASVEITEWLSLQAGYQLLILG